MTSMEEQRPAPYRQADERTAPTSTHLELPVSFQGTHLESLFIPIPEEALSHRGEYTYLGTSERGEEHEHSVALSTIANATTVPGVRLFINHFEDDGEVGSGMVLRFASVGCMRSYAAWLMGQADRLQAHSDAFEGLEANHG